ncbi:MAG: NAD(+)/NADH kinase, partial [Comamonadaceae bacterium]
MAARCAVARAGPGGRAALRPAPVRPAVVARGAVTRLIVLEAHINGQHYTTYRADGVIVSTATGSTGYSLAAGGPILHPNAQEFILVPIVPHLSLGNALVISSESQVQLKVR